MSTAQDNEFSYPRNNIVALEHVEAQPIGGGQTPILMPRQTMAGNTRGQQVVQGKLLVIDASGNVIAVIGQL